MKHEDNKGECTGEQVSALKLLIIDKSNFFKNLKNSSVQLLFTVNLFNLVNYL